MDITNLLINIGEGMTYKNCHLLFHKIELPEILKNK